jgi:hypothetical protein
MVFGAGSQMLGLLAGRGYLAARHDLDEWTDLLVCTKSFCSLLLCPFYLTVAFTAHPIEDFVWQYKVIPYKGHFRSSTLPRRLASDRAGKTASTSLGLRSVVAGMRWKGYRHCKPLKLEIPTSREPGNRRETVYESQQIFLLTSTVTAGRERIGRPGNSPCTSFPLTFPI